MAEKLLKNSVVLRKPWKVPGLDFAGEMLSSPGMRKVKVNSIERMQHHGPRAVCCELMLQFVSHLADFRKARQPQTASIIA